MLWMSESLRLLTVALTIVGAVLGLLAIPYVLTEAYGLEMRRPILLALLLVLAALLGGLLVLGLVRHKQTGREIELRERIERRIHEHKEHKHDTSEGSE